MKHNSALKIKLVPVNWSLWHQSKQSSFLPQQSQDSKLLSPFDQIELELWNVEFWRLKKPLWKLELYSVFLNVPIKHVQKQEKKLDCKRKRTFFISASFQLQHLKTKIMIFYVNFVSWACTVLNNAMHFWFLLLQIHVTIMNW